MPYYTHHKCKGAHHYVCVGVLSYCFDHWMPYYTLHKYKGAHHYACVDELSYWLFDWMPYCTLHMNMDAHPYVYHRNTRFQHCVGEVVLSKYTGKSTKVKH